MEVRHLKAMPGSCHWAQSLNDQKDFWHSPCWQWQRSPGTWGWCTFCRKRHGTSLPSHEGRSADQSDSPRPHVVFPRVSLIITIKKYSSSAEQNRWGRLQGTAGSASWLQQLFVFFFESQRRHFSRSSAGKDDLVCLRVGLSSIDSRGTLDNGSWTTAIVVVFTAMPWHFKPPWIARKPGQGRFEHFDDQKGAKRTRSWNWKWLQNHDQTFAPFFTGFRALSVAIKMYMLPW